MHASGSPLRICAFSFRIDFLQTLAVLATEGLFLYPSREVTNVAIINTYHLERFVP